MRVTVICSESLLQDTVYRVKDFWWNEHTELYEIDLEEVK